MEKELSMYEKRVLKLRNHVLSHNKDDIEDIDEVVIEDEDIKLDNKEETPLTEDELRKQNNTDILNMLKKLNIDVPNRATKDEMIEIARDNGLLGD